MPKSRKETNEKLRRYWKSNIENWETSGLTQIEYCGLDHKIGHFVRINSEPEKYHCNYNRLIVS